jgi:hypothetical protein
MRSIRSTKAAARLALGDEGAIDTIERYSDRQPYLYERRDDALHRVDMHVQERFPLAVARVCR